MYALVALLGTVACACLARALISTATERERRPWAIGAAVALAAMFYTHNWSLFFAAACGMTRVWSGKHFLTDVLAGAWLGYELAGVLWCRARLRALLNFLPDVSWYPRCDGAVEPVFAKEEVGRRKNVYRITTKGEQMFAELLEEAGQESWEDNRFRVRLAFFKYL